MSLLESVNYFDWPKAANKLAQLISTEELHPEVMSYLSNNMDKPWAISCSGGSDSLSSLLLIYGHFPDKRGDLFVLHYNHKLRGPESDAEALFVESCAKSLGLSFILGEGSASIEDKSEASLRQQRHQFFNKSLKSIDSQILVLGHQLDDVAETMLMRLGRGSGTGGLCAPRPMHIFRNGKLHLRPLINISKQRLLDTLEQAGISWCNDSSNEGEYYLRNRIRHSVIPDWASMLSGDFWSGISHSRDLLEEDDVALEAWLDHIFCDSPILAGSSLNIGLLVGLPKALYRRALHRWLHLNGLSKHFTLTSFSILLDALEKSEVFRMSVGKNYFVCLTQGSLFLEDNLSKPVVLEKNISPGICISWFEDKSLQAEEVQLTTELKKLIFSGKINPQNEVYLNYDGRAVLDLRVRTWRPGDRYRPLGAPGSRKLQDMFTDKKISRSRRYHLPVIYEKDMGIAWCSGFPIAEPFRIEENTQYALKLTFT